MPSFEKPTKRQVDIAVQRMRAPEFLAYFLKRLDNPLWIEDLGRAGFFSSPPPAIIREDGNISYPFWPPSTYLARMAASAPEEVARILGKIRSDNLYVVHDMVEAALAMPIKTAVTLVPAIAHAVGGRLSEFSYFPGFTDLCIQLAQSDHVNEALTLAEALFEPTFREDEVRRRDPHWYIRELQRAQPVLVTRRPEQVLELLCGWLHKVVSSMRVADSKTGDDHSYAWRPAIEDHHQNSEYDFASNLVAIVRDGFERALKDRLIPLANAFKILDRFRFHVFKRLKLFLIVYHSDDALAQQTILDRQVFDDVRLKHEYAILLDKRFDCLSPEQRETWFRLVDAGPKEGGEKREYWRFSKLHLIKRHLDDARRREYEQLFAKFGEPSLADFVVYHDTAWGNVSPMTVEELSKLEFAQAVESVSSWRPKESGWRKPEIEGLAETFSKYIDTNPTAFSAQAALMKGKPAIYLDRFIQKVTEAVRVGKEIDLDSMLELCAWVLTRPASERTTPVEARGPLADKDWNWTRDQIADFARQICDARRDKQATYPMEQYRTRIWSLIVPLCQGESDTYIARDTFSDDPRVRDYLDHAINSARGKALQAAFAYARWVALHVKEIKGRDEVVPGGFDQMLEVRQVLQWQLESEHRSVEGMAIFGAHLNALFWIDKSWIAENANVLFDLQNADERIRKTSWAGWNAFVVWVPAHFAYYTILKRQYSIAVTESVTVASMGDARQQPMFHLGEHLVLFYGRGQLGLDDDSSLLRRFLSEANPDIRRHALSFVGQSFEGKESVPAEVVTRMMTLWDLYWAGEGKKDAEQAPHEASFATWFVSDKFPHKWAIERMEEFTAMVALPQPDHGLIKQLAKICEADVAASMTILDRIVRADKEGWRIHSAIESVLEVLEHAMTAGGETKRLASELIDHLGRRGFLEVGKLLQG